MDTGCKPPTGHLNHTGVTSDLRVLGVQEVLRAGYAPKVLNSVVVAYPVDMVYVAIRCHSVPP